MQAAEPAAEPPERRRNMPRKVLCALLTAVIGILVVITVGNASKLTNDNMCGPVTFDSGAWAGVASAATHLLTFACILSKVSFKSEVGPCIVRHCLGNSQAVTFGRWLLIS